YNGQQLRNLFINGNRAFKRGAGVLLNLVAGTTSEVHMSHCIIGANTLNGQSGTDGGGGVCVLSGTAVLDHCDIDDNEISFAGVGTSGAGIYVANSAELRMNDCEVNQNRCNTIGAAGIHVSELGRIQMTSCSVRQNTNLGQGSGGMLLFGRGLLANCDFW